GDRWCSIPDDRKSIKVTTYVQDIQNDPIPDRSGCHYPGFKSQLQESKRFPFIYTHTGDHSGFADVPDRGAGTWVLQYSGKYILGYCYAYYRWLWRSLTRNSPG